MFGKAAVCPLLFIICMDKIIRRADVQGNVEVGEAIYNLLAFADDLVLLMTSTTCRNG